MSTRSAIARPAGENKTLRKAVAAQNRDLEARRPIDYDRMNRVHSKQKAALTRAIKSGDLDKLVATIKAAVVEWDEIGAWPDDWNRWQIALDDATGFLHSVDIRYL